MNHNDAKQVMSRLADDEFFDREAELERVLSLARRRLAMRSPNVDSDSVAEASAMQTATRDASRMRRVANVLSVPASKVRNPITVLV